MSSRYHETYQLWQSDPHDFWRNAAQAIDWIKPPDTLFDPDAGVYGHWFPDATCNTCWNAIDRHVAAGRGAQIAIIYDSPVTGIVRKITYAELRDEVATLAAVLQEHNVGKGDRVVIYMPMIPQALFGMLACARIGAIHSVVFGGFAAKELAKRLDDARPKLVLTASCGLEGSRIVPYKPLLDAAIDMVDVKPKACLVWQRAQAEAELVSGRDYDWSDAIAKAEAEGREASCVEVRATDPLYILYTSGTTGIPKGVVRDNGGHMVALAWSMPHLYNISPGEVFWTASDVGWVVGHSYIVYAPLLRGATTVLYEGKAVGSPDAGAFWRVIAEHKVVSLFTAPTAFRAIRKEDSDASLLRKYDISSLRALFLAGERADPNTVQWAEAVLKIPIIDHWWQTETGWCIAGNPVGLGGLPVKHGSATVAMPGYEVAVVDEGAQLAARGHMGSIVIKLPLPPGALPTLWQQDERMKDSYFAEFPGYYKTSDAGFVDADGYIFVMGRTDDIINVAGHRLSTGGMEEVLAAHRDVAECAVIGIKDELKGECPCGFAVLKAGVTRKPEDIEGELVQSVRDNIGAVAAFKLAIVVKRLPKTRSGKILRGTMKKIADHNPWNMPATIEDPTVLDEIAAALQMRGI
ncbi:propionyl-CoA synthetase [Methyloferula stellata]|uniref:propionyl-CoA synthetase n=1 Tax=Methyloferula stellata TaxID=876270 RepID=UPI0003629FEC|nr:propionyl-CoA synthetase [Methyloferula stellata]